MAAPDAQVDPIGAIDAVLRSGSRLLSATIGVAVSGGSDSTALLLAAIGWASTNGAEVLAATVDHGLRTESASEARAVAALCEARGVAHSILKIDALADGSGLQARAREARYDSLTAWARDTGVATVLMGHTADDVAETLMMRLSRGVGLNGLAAMAPQRTVGGISIVRPFLDIRRAALRDYLETRGFSWSEDPSNADPRFERVRIRQAMATLDLDPDKLVRSARDLDAARFLLDRFVDTDATAAFDEDRGDLILRVPPSDPELMRRLALLALEWIGGAQTPRHHEQSRFVAALLHVTAPITLAGCLISRERNGRSLRFAREPAACAPPVALAAASPKERTEMVWDRRWLICGPGSPNATIGALGEDISQTPWKSTGIPRTSLMATPALRRGGQLVAAPLAGLPGDLDARIATPFAATLRPLRTGRD